MCGLACAHAQKQVNINAKKITKSDIDTLLVVQSISREKAVKRKKI